MSMPNIRTVQRKRDQLHKLSTQPMTEVHPPTSSDFSSINLFLNMQSDLTAILSRKKALNPSRPSIAQAVTQRASLHQARSLAVSRRDLAELASIDAQLAQLEQASPSKKRERDEDGGDLLAKVNERNRRANDEQVRRAEAAELERKRAKRRAGANGNDQSHDPSARLKTVPKLFSSRCVSVEILFSDLLFCLLLTLNMLLSLGLEHPRHRRCPNLLQPLRQRRLPTHNHNRLNLSSHL